MPLSLGRPFFSDYTVCVHANFHRFLLMMLMLILPLQAFAAASMMGCMLNPAPVHAAPILMADCHESEQSDNSPAPHDCTHCAACALAAVLPLPLNASLALVPATLRFVTQPAASFSGFIPASPERPPRLSLA